LHSTPQGHGGRLLRAFYKMGRDDATVLDMSVEDPVIDVCAAKGRGEWRGGRRREKA